MNGKQHNIRLAILFAIFAGAVSILIAAGYGYYRQQTHDIRTRKLDELKAIAQLKCRQIVAWREEIQNDACSNIESPVVHAAIARWLQNPQDESLKAVIENHLKALVEIEKYDAAFIASPDSRPLAVASQHPVELTTEEKDLIATAASLRQIRFGKLFRCPICNEIHLDAAAPILDETGAPAAVLVLRADPAKELYPIIQTWPTPSKSAETLLIRFDENGVLFLNSLRHHNAPPLTLRIPISRSDVPAVQAALGKVGEFEGADYRGHKVLADLQPIPGSPWFLIAKVDASEILAEARYRGVVVLLLIAFATVIAGGLIAFMAKIQSTNAHMTTLAAERERLKSIVEILQHQPADTREFFDYALNQAISLTESKIGYIYFYNEEKKQFILHAWSNEAMKECSVVNPQTCYELDKTGVWGEAVRQRKPIILNDFQAPHPHKKGYPQGHVILRKYMTVPVFANDRIVAVVAVANKKTDYDQTDVLQLTLLLDAVWKVTGRRQAEDALRQSEQRFRMLFERSPLGYQSLDENGCFLEVNQTWLDVLGYQREEVIGHSFAEFLPPVYVEAFRERFPKFKEEGEVHNEFQMIRKDGSTIVVAFDGKIGYDNHGHFKQTHCVLNDITARKRAEEEQNNLREQLNQSQKMESVGRLAGGVAHDFNNMLQTILGNAEIALDSTEPSNPLRECLLEIQEAAKRSADLTRQLLAFARKQAINPRILNLNDTVTASLKMLQRLIGEDINLAWKPGAELWPVKMDPIQIDQILANLSVNARDAIAGVGSLTIETANAVFDRNYCADHPGFTPGEYTLLAVSDTGSGMNKDTLQHLFEPFFTTKAMGKGTGLGLATVYGIVRQNGGFINVYSEPDQGTTFKIYLARTVEDAETPAVAPEIQESTAHGTETILLVEDEKAILSLGERILEKHGYRVLAAGNPADAIALAKNHPDAIHLLITDVVMPGLSGKDMSAQIADARPGIRTLFMSGYTANSILHHGVLDPGIQFLQKPFSVNTLTRKVREILDQT